MLHFSHSFLSDSLANACLINSIPNGNEWKEEGRKGKPCMLQFCLISLSALLSFLSNVKRGGKNVVVAWDEVHSVGRESGTGNANAS
jgi:hypothetical protein